MSGKGGGKGKGGMTFTRQIPNFLQKMQENAHEDGIAGALKRHREKGGDEERSDRSDDEEERPLVVDAEDAMTSKQRRKNEVVDERAGRGSLVFKNSAKDRFTESAARRVQEAEEAAAAQAPTQAEDDATAAANGSHVFSTAKVPKKKEKKEKKGLGAKAIKNEKLLSFGMDDEEDG